MGKCTFCGECQRICPDNVIEFTTKHKISAERRDNLLISSETSYNEFEKTAIEAKYIIHKIFGNSLKLRSVSAGGCNACEMELNACSNVNFDMGRFGIEIVASPKALQMRKGMDIVSCPTCGRTKIDLISLANKVEIALKAYSELPITVAVMGCAVNGPGEAREADFGIAGGSGEGLLFANGEIVGKVPEHELVSGLVKLIQNKYPL